MIVQVLSVISALGMLGCCLGQQGTVPELDLSRYEGRWYQVYGARNNWFSYGPNAVCITADYAPINSTALSVENAYREETGNGPARDIRGTARTTADPGKLTIQFAGRPTARTYWILRTGPVQSADGRYAYSVVSNQDANVLYVLVRDLASWRRYDAEIRDFIEGRGYTDYWRQPIDIYHGDDCVYL